MKTIDKSWVFLMLLSILMAVTGGEMVVVASFGTVALLGFILSLIDGEIIK